MFEASDQSIPDGMATDIFGHGNKMKQLNRRIVHSSDNEREVCQSPQIAVLLLCLYAFSFRAIISMGKTHWSRSFRASARTHTHFANVKQSCSHMEHKGTLVILSISIL